MRMKSFVVELLSKAIASPASQTVLIAMTSTANAQSPLGTSEASSDPISQTVPVVKVAFFTILALAIPAIVRQGTPIVLDHPWFYRLLWGLAFAINCITVSIPGRFDTELKDGKIDIPWRTLFEPSGWAFSIWAVIYIGEILLTAYAVLYGQPVLPFKESSPYWLAANLYQSLWCLTFRPAFKRILYFSSFFLPLGSACLLLCYQYFHKYINEASTAKALSMSSVPMAIAALMVPIALHATWLAGATLLNINGWASVARYSKANQVAIAFTSAFVAGLVGTILTGLTGNPFFAWTSAWALAALSEKSSQSLNKNFDDDMQKGLSTIEFSLMRMNQIVGIIASIMTAMRWTSK